MQKLEPKKFTDAVEEISIGQRQVCSGHSMWNENGKAVLDEHR